MNNASNLDHSLFSSLDRHFARLMERLSGGINSDLALAAALTSWSQRQGNVCLDLTALAQDGLLRSGREDGLLGSVGESPDGEYATLHLPPLGTWVALLRQSPVVGQPGEFKPLILDPKSRLYLHRWWRYESDLAHAIRDRSATEVLVDRTWLSEALARYFADDDKSDTDWQKVSAFVAITRRFCVITGGPGTGKTRTVAVLLAMLLEQPGANPLRIALAAPTGKAAARLQESIKSIQSTLPCRDSIKAGMPQEAFTLHRLLGSRLEATRFQSDATRPLAFDVVVIDEASMVDLGLMAKLFAALPPQARVILLGDKDQLASVEAGAVLGDICHGANSSASEHVQTSLRMLKSGRSPTEMPEAGGALRDCIVHLEKNYRFETGSGILALSRAVNDGDAEQVLRLLSAPSRATAGITSRPLPSAARLKDRLRASVVSGFQEVLAAPDAATALSALNGFRILCALRQGPFGAGAVNRLVEEILVEAKLIHRNERWFAGRPVMILKNDYDLRLFNGDVGIVLPDSESGQTRVFFRGANEELRRLVPARLPEHETVFATTVHKSQGSEFDRVLFISPDRDNPILTRELFYTAITRARRAVELWFSEAVLRDAIGRRVERASGLREALWPGPSGSRK
jgi:exodeoxyribonuclease V alpha subunit